MTNTKAAQSPGSTIPEEMRAMILGSLDDPKYAVDLLAAHVHDDAGCGPRNLAIAIAKLTDPVDVLVLAYQLGGGVEALQQMLRDQLEPSPLPGWTLGIPKAVGE